MIKSLSKKVSIKPTCNIILHIGRLNTFLLRFKANQGYLLSPVLFIIILKVPASVTVKKKMNENEKYKNYRM